MRRFRFVVRVFRLGLPFALAACGGGGVTAPMPSSGRAAIHTLAYVVDECRQNGRDFFERGALVIRDGDRDPVTVAEVPETGPVQAVTGLCRSQGIVGFGDGSARSGGFTRLQVSPDGSTVVFEETDEFSVPFHNVPFLTPEERGIFVVRADGTGLRRLGPPSREPPFGPIGIFGFTFSPDGRTIAFPDRGPSLVGDDASQLFTLDLATGARVQLTHFPPGGISFPTFLDDETIAFYTLANPDDLNPEGKLVVFTVKVDGSALTLVTPVALPGGGIVPIFAITGARPTAVALFLSGAPSGPPHNTSFTTILDLFLLDGPNLLQLTNFRRSDTGQMGELVSTDRQHVFFVASADPLGTNPAENCQLFSIDRTGGDLRQLTNFHESEPSQSGCDFNRFPGCRVELTAQDATAKTLVFSSGCDPLGTNPSGEQIFAMRPDGSGLRQLTNLRGLFTDADGSVHAELPGPSAYGPGPSGNP